MYKFYKYVYRYKYEEIQNIGTLFVLVIRIKAGPIRYANGLGIQEMRLPLLQLRSEMRS
jgi:hypothetical protein